MEKRLILSLALSFAVLYGWAALGPKQPDTNNFSLDSQDVGTEEFTEEPRASDYTSPSFEAAKEAAIQESDRNINDDDASFTAEEVATEAATPEIETVLENDKLVVEMSTLGGNIKSVYIKEYDTTLPLNNLAGLPSYDTKTFTLFESTESYVEYHLNLAQGAIVKRFQLNDGDYTIQASVRMIKNSEMSNLNDVSFQGFTLNIPEEEKSGGFGGDRNQALYEYVVQTEEKTLRKNNAYKFSEKNDKMDFQPVQWVGFRNRYFCAIVKPEFETSGYSIKSKNEKVLNISYTVKGESLASVSNPEWTSLIYVGPELVSELKKYELGFEEIQRYYRWGVFDGIAKIIQGLMHFVYKLMPNWGVAIILISLLIYGCTYPMTIKSMSSMKKMQALQPKMATIKEKYAKNPQKMNQEMMELYKKEKVNPLGGCLPMFLQLPVFIGLYQVLWRSVEFKGAGFLWIKDLSEPDRLFVLKGSIPFIGSDINILPILMMGIMFIQQKLSAKNMVVSDPMQAQQQKMMQTIFPIFLGVIFYKFSSGLTLYFTMFYILSAFTQWKIAGQPKTA